MSAPREIRHRSTSNSLSALGLDAPRANWFMKSQRFVREGAGKQIRSILVTDDDCAKHDAYMGTGKHDVECEDAGCVWKTGGVYGGWCVAPGSNKPEPKREQAESESETAETTETTSDQAPTQDKAQTAPTWTERSCFELLCSQNPPITDNG